MTPSRQIDLCLVCWKGMQGQWEVPGLASTVDGRAQFRGLRFSRLHGPPMPVLFARVGGSRWASSWRRPRGPHRASHPLRVENERLPSPAVDEEEF